MTTPVATSGSALTCRPPSAADAVRVHALVHACPPLELNSIYAYLLMCTHFAGTSAVAERDGHCVGFLSAYVKPDSATDLFVWQVAVASDARGQGLARQMIQHVLGRSGAHPLRFVEATVTPDNQASRGLFQALAAAHGAALSESLAFSQDDFGQTDHAVEHLLRIGPFSPSRHTHS